jgi:hypothetical protein
MSGLLSSIETIIRNAIEEYSKKICEKYDNVEIDELERIWNDLSDSIKISVSVKSSGKKRVSKSKVEDEETETKEDDTKSVKSSKSSGSDRPGCPYTITKGKNQGETCKIKPKVGNVYCSRHVKYEGTTTEPKVNKVPQVKKTIEEEEKSSPKSKISQNKRVLRKNKNIGDQLWHVETRLVFKTLDEKPTAYCKYIDGKLVNLKDEDVDKCKEFGFYYKVEDVENISSEPTVSKETVLESLLENSKVETEIQVKKTIKNIPEKGIEETLKEVQKPVVMDKKKKPLVVVEEPKKKKSLKDMKKDIPKIVEKKEEEEDEDELLEEEVFDEE